MYNYDNYSDLLTLSDDYKTLYVTQNDTHTSITLEDDRKKYTSMQPDHHFPHH